MTHSLRSCLRGCLGPAAVTLVLLLSGCSSDAGRAERPAASTMPRRRPTPMAGQETFFDGQILAEIKVGTDGVPDAAASEGGGQGGGEGRQARGGGRSQLGISGGAGGFSGGYGGGGGGRGRRGGGEGGGGEGGERPASGPRLGLMAHGRPVMIHLRFTNQGAAPVTLVIDDFVSPLGNFAVRPEQLVLAPGQALETDPMTSQLAGTLSEADATLVLRIGAKGEKKTFHLTAVKPPADVPKEEAGPQAPNPPKS